jgi:aminomethyltransferase
MSDLIDAPPRRSPLHAEHEALGAAFTDFGGWSMPVRYASDLAEHHAVRTTAGLFDISHMAEFRVAGPGAAAFLDDALTLDASALPRQKAKYALALQEDGGIIDDLIVYRTGAEEFLVVANAGNRAPIAAALAARRADHDATIVDETDATALIAVQGPASERILLATVGLAVPGLSGLGFYACLPGEYAGAAALVARTGYTGEDGFEIFLPAVSVTALWRAILTAGAELGLVPCGLAARDTLRLEAGMPLYGHELSTSIRPAQAGLARALPLATKASDFVGRAAVEPGLSADARVLVGLASEGRRAGRDGYVVRHPDGAEVGVVTSGALSPTLGHPIAMAYVDQGAGPDLRIDVRGTLLPATVVPLPFLPRPEQRGAR